MASMTANWLEGIRQKSRKINEKTLGVKVKIARHPHAVTADAYITIVAENDKFHEILMVKSEVEKLVEQSVRLLDDGDVLNMIERLISSRKSAPATKGRDSDTLARK